MLGYLWRRSPRSNDDTQLRFIDRGLFLLVIGHLLIEGAHYQRIHGYADALHQLFMTDTIGVSLIAGALFVPKLPTRPRLACAAAIYVVSWLLVLFWQPTHQGWAVLKDIAVGSLAASEAIQQNFPLAPWFALFMIGSVLGERLSRATRPAELERLARRMLLLASVAVAGGLALKIGYLAIRPTSLAGTPKSGANLPPFWIDLYSLTSPFCKHPPAPAYLLFYGGLGVAVIAGCLLATQRGWLAGTIRWTSVIGRASLVVFVVQFYVYYLVIAALVHTNTWLLPLYGSASVMLLWCVARAWLRWGDNQLLTLGLARPLSSRRLAQ
jgi:uncharacterized membrane protein